MILILCVLGGDPSGAPLRPTIWGAPEERVREAVPGARERGGRAIVRGVVRYDRYHAGGSVPGGHRESQTGGR